jgi:hypothetical protein
MSVCNFQNKKKSIINLKKCIPVLIPQEDEKTIGGNQM